MAPTDTQFKHEALFVAYIAASNGTVNNARLAALSNLLTGKADTPNAVECRLREFKKKARDLLALEIDQDGKSVAVPVAATRRPRASKAAATTGATKTGRVTKTKKSARPTEVKVEAENEEEDEEAV